MRTVLDRARNGRALAGLAYRGSGQVAEGEFQEALVDALANLMHFARREGLDWLAALDSADHHHAAESRFDWHEEPS